MTGRQDAPASRGRELLWGGVLVAAAVSAYLGFVAYDIVSNQLTFAHDDAFITYAYAANLAHGLGPVFNLGERVWGYTSPLHVFILAGLGSLGMPIHAASIGLSFGLILPISLLVFLLLAESTGSVRLAAPIALLVAPSRGLVGHEGLEPNLCIFGVLLFIWLARQRHHGLTGFVGGLCCLARPDAVLFVAPILLIDHRLRHPRALAFFVAAPVAWLAFTALYYKTILPSSFHHKAGNSSFVAYLVHTRGAMLQDVAGLGSISSWLGGWAIAVKIGLLVIAIRHWVRRSEFTLLYGFVVGPLLIWLAYAIIGAPPSHRWEVKAPVVLFSLAPLWGVTIGVRWLLARAQARFGRSVQIGAAAVGALLLAASCASSAILTHRYFVKQEDEESRGRRYRAYERIAAWLHDHLPRNARVDLVEPGTIRYLIQRPDVWLMDSGLCSRSNDVVAPTRDRPLFVLIRGSLTHSHEPPKPLPTENVEQAFPNLDGFRAHVLVKVRTKSLAQLKVLHRANTPR